MMSGTPGPPGISHRIMLLTGVKSQSIETVLGVGVHSKHLQVAMHGPAACI